MSGDAKEAGNSTVLGQGNTPAVGCWCVPSPTCFRDKDSTHSLYKAFTRKKPDRKKFSQNDNSFCSNDANGTNGENDTPSFKSSKSYDKVSQLDSLLSETVTESLNDMTTDNRRGTFNRRKSQYGRQLLITKKSVETTDTVLKQTSQGVSTLGRNETKLLRHPVSRVVVSKQVAKPPPIQKEEPKARRGKPGLFSFLRSFDPSLYQQVGFFDCLDTLAEGDIVLFHTKKFASRLQRTVVASGGFDHIGLVVVYDNCSDEVCCPRELKKARKGAGVKAWHTLEADSSGVSLYRFTPFCLGAYKGSVCIRHLELDEAHFPEERKNAMHRILNEFVDSMNGRPYEKSVMQILRAANIFGQNEEEDLSSVFCSELVAAAYLRLGLFAENKKRPSNSYIPGDFASKNQKSNRAIKLVPGASLTRESIIDCKNMRLDGKAEAAKKEGPSLSVSSQATILTLGDSSSALDKLLQPPVDCDSSGFFLRGSEKHLQSSSQNLGVLAKSKHKAFEVQSPTFPNSRRQMVDQEDDDLLATTEDIRREETCDLKEQPPVDEAEVGVGVAQFGETLQARRARPSSLSMMPKKEVDRFAQFVVRENLQPNDDKRRPVSVAVKHSAPLRLSELNSNIISELKDRKLARYAYSAGPSLPSGSSGSSSSSSGSAGMLSKLSKASSSCETTADDESKVRMRSGSSSCLEKDSAEDVAASTISDIMTLEEKERRIQFVYAEELSILNYNFSVSNNQGENSNGGEAERALTVGFTIVGPIDDGIIKEIEENNQNGQCADFKKEEELDKKIRCTAGICVSKLCKVSDVVFDTLTLSQVGWYQLRWENLKGTVNISFLCRLDDKNS